MKEAVTIIVTCFNLEMYIAEAIDSVFNQFEAPELEVIVVDDCSTDNSLSVIRKYSQVKVIELNQNVGVMQAMLAGLKFATNDLVFFLDGDDVWQKEKLFSILSVIDSETGLFTHDLSYVDKTGLSIRKTSSISWAFSGKNSDEANMLIRQCLLSHGDFVWLGSAFGVRRSRCDIDNFIKFVSPRPDIKYCYQDWPLAVWIAAMPNSKFKYIDKKLFKYRIHDKNYSSSAPNLGDRRRNIYKSYSTYLLIYDILTYKNMDINYIKKANFMVKRHKLLLILLEGSTRTAFSFMVKNYKVIFSEDLSLNFFIKYSLYFILGPNLASYVIYRMGGFSRAIHSS